MKRGFTLIELSFVLAVMAVLVAATVPAYQSLVLRARAEEARTMTSAIAHAELRHHRDHGKFVECATLPALAGAPFPNEQPCWRALGIGADGPVRYHYQVVLHDGSFSVVAAADLDGDGVRSRYTLDGRTLSLTIENELE